MPFDYLMSWLPFTHIDRTIFPPEHFYFLAEYDKTLRYRLENQISNNYLFNMNFAFFIILKFWTIIWHITR